MNRLARALQQGRRQRRPLIVPFVTAGFPTLAATVPIVEAMAAAGADAVEIGIPFSDPLADGPTIQRSSERALANGTRVAHVFEFVERLRDGGAAELPILLMGYCNPIFRMGLERFVERTRAAGADGLIVADLPPEEAAEYRRACVDCELAAVFLMAPNAPDERIRRVDEASTHVSYCVTVTGVTGARGDVQARTVRFLQQVRRLARKPFVAGFGVREPEHVRRLGALADGVVIGSALIDLMENAADPVAAAAGRVAALRAAADQVAGDTDDPRGERA